ncbi:MAG: hypothetical protein ACK4GR_01680 [bacterium]
MELYLKIGNRNISFIFTEDNKILDIFDIPCYVTLDKNDKILNFGPLSFLQYILIKQSNKISDYPLVLRNREENFDYKVERLVENNFIQDYNIFFKIMESIFSGKIHLLYDISIIEDYKKYEIPFFTNFDHFHKLIKQTKKVIWVNFIDKNSPYFKNQKNFLKDVFSYLKLKLEVVPFWEFFKNFHYKMMNFYIGEQNFYIWIANNFGFVKYQKIDDINLRKIRESLSKELLSNGYFLKYKELENLSINFLSNHDFLTFKYFQSKLREKIINFVKSLQPTILEDFYEQITAQKENSINVFLSINEKNIVFSRKFLEIFEEILIRS